MIKAETLKVVGMLLVDRHLSCGRERTAQLSCWRLTRHMSLGGDGTVNTAAAAAAAGDGGGMEAATLNACCPTLRAASYQHTAALASGAVSGLPNTG